VLKPYGAFHVSNGSRLCPLRHSHSGGTKLRT
jgi:hypothetical protein